MGSIYQTVFGGNVVAPAIPTYLALTISSNVLLGWPLESNITAPSAAEIIDVTATTTGLVVQLSDARQVGTGYCALFNNVGANTFTVQDNLGNTLMAPAPGQAWQLYLADNSTQQGTWRTFQYGASTSTANAAALAGAGLKAISTTLNEQILLVPQAANYTIGTGTNQDRASCIEWTGGAGGIFSSSLASTLGSGWFCYIKNSGTGVVSFVPGSGQINGSSSMTFNPNDSAIIVTDGTNFFSIGYGQSVASSFNFVQISLTPPGTGTIVLTGAQLNRISYRFTGALTGNVIVQVPASIQQYWVDNETTGAFTLTVSAGGSGSTVTVPQGARTILYCDGLNIVQAITGSGVLFGNGTAAAPSITFASDTSTGLYLPGTHVLGFAAGGIAVGSVNGSGQWSLPATTAGVLMTLGAIDNSAAIVINDASPTSGYSITFQNSGTTLGQIGLGPQTLTGAAIGDFSIVANTGVLRLGTGTATRISVSATGNVTVNAPGSGAAVTSTATGTGAAYVANTVSTGAGFSAVGAAATLLTALLFNQSGQTGWSIYQPASSSDFRINNGADRVTITTNGNVTVSAPASGIALTATGAANAATVSVTGSSTSGQSLGVLIKSGTTSADYGLQVQNQAGTLVAFNVTGTGVVQGNDGTNLFELGYKGCPENAQGANYTLALSDRGKVVPGTTSISVTVPSGVFSTGDAVGIQAPPGSTVTIVQGTGMTMQWAGNGSSTGNRTLTGAGLCVVLFGNSTFSMIAGSGLT